MPTKKEIQKELKRRDLKISGSKDELVERLMKESTQERSVKKVYLEDINGTYVDTYSLEATGGDFLEKAREVARKTGHSIVLNDPRL